MRRVLTIPLCLAAAACASAPKSAPPPILSVESATCAALPDLSRSTALVFDPKDEKALSVDMGAASPCLSRGSDGKSVYAVFALPPGDAPFSITVASAPVGYGLFAPRVELMDDKGAVLRNYAFDSFVFHNEDLSVVFRNHPAERYLVVSAEPHSIGQSVSRVREQTSMTPVVAGPAVFYAHTGSDETTNLVYAYSGKVSVTLAAIPAGK
jgi:hypothetical protein